MRLALISTYSPPDDKLLVESSGALISCKYMGASHYTVINVKSIVAVVAMVPHPRTASALTEHFFVVEKPGLDIAFISEKGETDETEDI